LKPDFAIEISTFRTFRGQPILDYNLTNPCKDKDRSQIDESGALSFCVEKPVVPVGNQMERSFSQ